MHSSRTHSTERNPIKRSFAARRHMSPFIILFIIETRQFPFQIQVVAKMKVGLIMILCSIIALVMRLLDLPRPTQACWRCRVEGCLSLYLRMLHYLRQVQPSARLQGRKGSTFWSSQPQQHTLPMLLSCMQSSLQRKDLPSKYFQINLQIARLHLCTIMCPSTRICAC